ncbi:MAG: hypothetical protein FJ197_13025, partial [Gammaproteobacteria bacterium]|nr:hypothetical protein [Gammaproteobacteria bacterium]
MPIPFFGRDHELATLQRLFAEVATRGPDGAFGGPRLAVITAETGYGKSRLVQELYLRLTSDPTWDPPEVDYWPPAFGEIGAQLRVSPDMSGHVAKGPPRFLWLGARWQPIDQRNVDTRCALPDLRSEFGVHLAVIERSKSHWARAVDATKRAVRKDGVGEVLSQAADQAVPLGGLLLRLAKAGKDLLGDRSSRDRGHDGARAEQAQDIVDELMECFTEALHGRAALPVVVWLDDAQWMDRETLRWLQRLWREATAKRWPVLVVVTHWEREWRQRRKLPPAERDATLAAFEGRPGVAIVPLPPAGDDALASYLRTQLPGLLPGQQRLLLDKAAGNFLTMVENVGDLRNEPMNFVDGEVDKALAPEGEDRVTTWESERDKRVEQRFKELQPKVRNLLGWSSQLGVRFLHAVVTDFAARMAGVPEAPAMLEWCVDPGVILGTPSKRLREFRDRAFHFVAQKHFAAYGQRHAAQLTAALREHLIGWIERSFGDDGRLLGLDEDRPDAPEDSAVALSVAGETAELRDLLDLALRQLPMPAVLDWSKPADRAALRAVHLALRNDEQDNLWDRVRATAVGLEGVAWAQVPGDVLAEASLGSMGERLQTAGLPQLACAVRKRRVALLRGEAHDPDGRERVWGAVD